MEWLTEVRKAIDYIENHLNENISSKDVTDQLYISALHFHKGFVVMTGYSVAEYIRNRRLYLAASDLINTDKKVIDIALSYGYETPESFSKAFSRFHGNSPLAVRNGSSYKTFLPINIKVVVSGGNEMNYRIVKMFSTKFVGFVREFSYDNSQKEIPLFWNEIYEKYMSNVYSGNEAENEYQQAVIDYNIGEYGICIDDEKAAEKGKFLYMVAGKYTGGKVPEKMMVYEFEAGQWAIFDCVGAIPESLQSLNNRIFKQWLPGNPDYEISGHGNVEWYDNGDNTDPDYHTAIWIPVKEKQHNQQ